MNLVELELDETLADFEVQNWIDNVFSVQYPDVKARIKKGCSGLCHKKDEWHYVKDGDLPKENEYIMIYSKLADNIAVGKRRCAGKIRKRCVYEWYFATYEGTYCLRDKDVIAWKEIALPELKERD